MQIIVDVDDVVVNLMEYCVRKFNKETGLWLKKDQIRSWDIASYTDPEKARIFYEYFKDPLIYNAIGPIEGALNSINILRENGHRIVFCTVNNYDNCKANWLFRHEFMEDIKDFAVVHDKNLIRGDIILDDAPHFIQNSVFKYPVVFTQPWNEDINFKNRVNNWKEFLKLVEELQWLF